MHLHWSTADLVLCLYHLNVQHPPNNMHDLFTNEYVMLSTKNSLAPLRKMILFPALPAISYLFLL